MASRNPTEGFFTKLLALGTYALCAFLLIGYALGYTLWWTHWFTGFWLIGMPEVMILVALLTLFWFFKKVSRAWFPLLVLLIGWPFWQRTLTYHPEQKQASSAKTLDVVTFNSTFFNHDHYGETKDLRVSKEMIDWVGTSNADVLCFQEYYSWKGGDKPKIFLTSEVFRKAGYPYAIFADDSPQVKLNSDVLFMGVSLFSKYPIIRKKASVFRANHMGYNGYVRADIKKGEDTLRVISVHLYSMGVRVGKVVKAANSKSAKAETRSILQQLKAGFIAHNEEIEEVLQEVKNSPYPVILCGDYNEVPTGIAYGKTRRYLKNSFEEAGNGFGFTLNRSPWFIRIDNQFHSNHFKVLRHQVHREIKGSDHFPVQVLYEY